jgi:hypothetical protein
LIVRLILGPKEQRDGTLFAHPPELLQVGFFRLQLLSVTNLKLTPFSGVVAKPLS